LLKFRLEWIAGEIGRNAVALIVIIGLLALAVLAGWFLLGGPATVEPAQVLGFGTYETDYGTRSVVRIRTRSGEVHELVAANVSLLSCLPGSRILVVRRPHSLIVDPRGCIRGEEPLKLQR
jgi:hypothetical protein